MERKVREDREIREVREIRENDAVLRTEYDMPCHVPKLLKFPKFLKLPTKEKDSVANAPNPPHYLPIYTAENHFK